MKLESIENLALLGIVGYVVLVGVPVSVWGNEVARFGGSSPTTQTPAGPFDISDWLGRVGTPNWGSLWEGRVQW